MKVLILSTVHHWNDPRIFHKQACTLAKEHEVTLAAAGTGGERVVSGVRVRPLGVWKSRSDRPRLWRRAHAEIARSKADVLHFHDPELALLLLPWVLLSRKKFVYDIHEHPVGGYGRRRWIPGLLRQPVARLFPWFILHTPYLFDAVIIAEDGYRHLFPDRKNVHLIRNYALIPDPDLACFDRYANFDPAKDLRLLYFGQLLVQRGAWIMVEMMQILAARFPGVSLDLVGEAMPPALGEQLRRAAEQSQGRIRLHGYVDFNDAGALLQQAHLGLIPLQPDPNHEGSLATKFFDYMVYGLPFVASDLPHWRSFIDQNPAGVYADATDVERFAEAVSSLVESPQKLRELSHNGYRLVRERFRWETEGERLLKIYRELA